MRASPILSLPPDGRVPLGGPEGLEPALRTAIETLAAGGATEAALCTQVRAAGGAGALLRFHQMLADLTEARLLCRGVACGGEPLVTVVPCSRFAPEPRESPAPPGPFVLSRFACLRRVDRSLIAESPLAHSYLVLHGAAGALLMARLAAAADAADAVRLAAGIPDLREDEARLCLDLLWEAGFLSPVGAEGVALEDADPELLPWEFHDLLFHSRSRAGRHRNPYGGTLPFRGVIYPLPVLKPPRSNRSDNTVELFRPDLEQLLRDDPPFTRVLEERRSRREPGEQPITVRQLGELLFRSSRVRALDEISDRVYPGAGAVYELEIYPVVRSCAGLLPGLYHYDPEAHRLERLSGMSPEARQLLESAGRTASAEPPEVLLVLAARFQRMTWKYRSMAYAAILKDVGVLYQTMCLVAAAMGLAACALGGGDSDLFARAAGTRYTAETSVGELILNRGSAPE